MQIITDNLVIMFGIGIGFIAIILVATLMKANNTKDARELQEIETQLTAQITAKQEQLNEMQKQIDSKEVNKIVNMTQQQVDVLDIYEQSGIRIPADIIEDLTVFQFNDEKEIYDYIENQRNYWKLENQKKPFKKVK